MGSITGGKSESGSSSFSKSRQNVWGDQSPFLMDLYQRGADLMGGFQPTKGINRDARAAWRQQLNPQMNPYLDQMTAQYTQALGQLDNQTGMGAAGAGTFGGGRQGVEQYLNQQNIGNQLGNFLGSQYQADQARALSALQMSPMMQSMTNQMQPWGALQMYSGLLGSPTVLGRSTSQGRSSSDSKEKGLGIT